MWALALLGCSFDPTDCALYGPVPTWQEDADGDGYGAGMRVVACLPPAGFAERGGDCDDSDPMRHPGAVEGIGDGVDQDCDGREFCFRDDDRDGVGSAEVVSKNGLLCSAGLAFETGDCDDDNARRAPIYEEVHCDGVDNDCDGSTLDAPDGDDDGLTVCAGDCDDTRSDTRPGADEVPADGVDQDCDGLDLCFVDADGDGVGGTDVVAAEAPCPLSGLSNADCDDDNASVGPTQVEVLCDGLDNDCDPTTPDAADLDGDGFPACEDCDDADSERFPGAPEIVADAVDQDCDGVDDCFVDADGDGWGTEAVTRGPGLQCPLGGSRAGDCDDTTNLVAPGLVEIPCDGVDQDCDPSTEDARDGDGDGASVCIDCDDADAERSPLHAEVCDGVDRDCSGATEDADWPCIPIDIETWVIDPDNGRRVDGRGLDLDPSRGFDLPGGAHWAVLDGGDVSLWEAEGPGVARVTQSFPTLHPLGGASATGGVLVTDPTYSSFGRVHWVCDPPLSAGWDVAFEGSTLFGEGAGVLGAVVAGHGDWLAVSDPDQAVYLLRGADLPCVGTDAVVDVAASVWTGPVGFGSSVAVRDAWLAIGSDGGVQWEPVIPGSGLGGAWSGGLPDALSWCDLDDDGAAELYVSQAGVVVGLEIDGSERARFTGGPGFGRSLHCSREGFEEVLFVASDGRVEGFFDTAGGPLRLFTGVPTVVSGAGGGGVWLGETGGSGWRIAVDTLVGP